MLDYTAEKLKGMSQHQIGNEVLYRMRPYEGFCPADLENLLKLAAQNKLSETDFAKMKYYIVHDKKQPTKVPAKQTKAVPAKQTKAVPAKQRKQTKPKVLTHVVLERQGRSYIEITEGKKPVRVYIS